MRAKILLAGALSCWWGATGCGDDSDDGQMDADAFCASECEQRVGTNCLATPMEYTQPECESICRARYTNYSQCEAQLKVVDQCLAEQVSYVCGATGAIEATPPEACANEVRACLSCTNDLSGCTL